MSEWKVENSEMFLGKIAQNASEFLFSIFIRVVIG
jgi:hypothetical protein